MDPTKSAATYLTELRHTGRFGARIPEPFRPATIEDALKIQERTVRVLGEEVGGYKCSLPNADRAAVLAPIFAPTISATTPRAVRGPTETTPDVARIEPEVAFVMAKPLPARPAADGSHRPYSEAEVRAAIGETRLVLEVLGTRYRDQSQVPFVEVLADCISNQGLVVGPLVRGGLDAELAGFRFRIDGKPRGEGAPVAVEKDGRHPDGHPLRPLVWLANFLAARGSGLRAGQTITTGSYAGMIDVPVDVPLTLQYGELGTFDVEFSRAAA